MKSLDDLQVAGKTVLVRADFNVPLADGSDGSRVITDDGRIQAALPTLTYLRDNGATIVVVSHLGRAKGEYVADLSLAPVARRLGELLGTTVTLTALSDAKAVVEAASAGDVVLLENIRFDARETSKDPAERQSLAQELAALADIYVSDGFGVVHRDQASVTDVARLLPCAAGRLVHKEASVFGGIMADPARPFVVILGGAKVSDKLGVIGNLISRVDRLLIGGGMAYTFLAAQGFGVGASLLEADQIETVKGFIDQARESGVELLVPVDIVVADKFAADASTAIVDVSEIPDGWMGLDIGPRTCELFSSRISGAGTVVWNGPMGVFEMPAFAAGTIAVATAMAESDAVTIIGGGDSAAAVRILDVDEDAFTHISTGGGASLEFLEGKTLPGLAVLEEGA